MKVCAAGLTECRSSERISHHSMISADFSIVDVEQQAALEELATPARQERANGLHGI
jgi:hypothetical protein